MFKLNTGTYAALEEAFVKDLLAQKQADPLANILVLSPSGRLLSQLQSRLSAAKPGFIHISFLTFYALAEKVMADNPSTEDRVVTETALFREIITDFLEGQESVPFSSRDAFRRPGTAIPNGLAGALASTLKDLQDSGAKVVDCANVAREGHLGESTDNTVPILELNVLMYKALHDRGLRTGADFFRRAAERIPQNEWTNRQDAVYLYGFYDLTGVQLDLVQAFSQHRNAALYFPYDKDRPAYAYAEKLLSDLRIKAPSVTVLPSPATPAPETEAHSCSGTHNEVWWTAKKILEQADNGVPFTQMAVIARTLDPYLNTLREVFETHKIPYALHAEEPVGAYPLVKVARQILRGEIGEGSPYVRLTSDPSLQELGRTGGPKAVGEAPWSSHVAWAKNLLDKALRLPKDVTATEQRQWDGLIGAVESLSQLDVLGRPVSREHFLDILEDKLERLRLQLVSDNVTGVQVMDVMTARGLRFDSVFVLGLNEKLFPRLIREDPFLSDSARSALAQALGCRLGRKMDGFQEEKLLFQLALESAKKHLHLSCQRSDEEGKALVISLYLHDFLKRTGVVLNPLPRAWPERVKRADRAGLTPKEISIAYHRDGQSPDALYERMAWNRSLLTHLVNSQKELEGFDVLGRHDGLIGEDPLAKAILEKGLSPQTLKDLAECPFKVYSRKVLELYVDPGDTEEGQLTHSGRGKLIHNILQTYYQDGLLSIDLAPTMNEAFARVAEEHPEVYPLALQAEKGKVLAMLQRFIPLDQADQGSTGFKPTYFEVPQSQTIRGIKLQGRIDRLDTRAGPQAGFRVVDYKSGSAGIKKGQKLDTAIMKGESFQLPIYLALAKTWLESQNDPAAKNGSAVFYELREKDAVDSAHRMEADFWTANGERFYENLAFLVKNIENGSFYIRPSAGRGYCEWCDYRSICRREHKPTQIRSENSAQRRRHEEAFTPLKD